MFGDQNLYNSDSEDEVPKVLTSIRMIATAEPDSTAQEEKNSHAEMELDNGKSATVDQAEEAKGGGFSALLMQTETTTT